MSNEVVTIDQNNLPAHLQEDIGNEVFNELSSGVVSGFPVISYRGKVWRVKEKGEVQDYLDVNGDAMPSIEVVLLRSMENLSKIYFRGKYKEGDTGKPDCSSANGIRPDSNVAEPVSALCATCPNNKWGSKITDEGKQARACSDNRRVVVAFSQQLEEVENGKRRVEDVTCLLIHIPPASLNPLKEYAERVLKPKGIPPFSLVTRIGFDSDASYPKLTFRASRFLTAKEYSSAKVLRQSDEALRMLDESEYGEGETTGTAGEAPLATAPASEEAAVPASPKPSPKKRKPTPVEEPTRAVDIESAASEGSEEVAEVASSTPAPTPVAPKSTEAAQPSPAAPEVDDFDALLDQLLD